MKKKYKISLIVPCYNVEKYLGKCLKSIENQTFGIENIEVILVNDGSTDGTGVILSSFAARHNESVLYLDFPENRGLSAARNAGLDMANGEYVAFIDSDDFISDDMCQVLYQSVLESDETLDIISGSHIPVWNENDISYQDNDGFVIDDLTLEATRKQYIINLSAPVYDTVWRRLYRRAFLDEYKIRFFEGHVYEDMHFCMMCILLAKNFCQSNKVVYFYRQADNSISRSNFNIQKNRDRVLVMNHVYDDLKALGKYDELMEKYRYEIGAIYMWNAYFDTIRELERACQNEIEFVKKNVMELHPESVTSPYMLNIQDENMKRMFKYLEEK